MCISSPSHCPLPTSECSIWDCELQALYGGGARDAVLIVGGVHINNFAVILDYGLTSVLLFMAAKSFKRVLKGSEHQLQFVMQVPGIYLRWELLVLALCTVLLVLALMDHGTAGVIAWQDGVLPCNGCAVSRIVKHPVVCNNPDGTQHLTMGWCLCCRGCCSWASCSCRRRLSQRPWASSSSCRQPAGGCIIGRV